MVSMKFFTQVYVLERVNDVARKKIETSSPYQEHKELKQF